MGYVLFGSYMIKGSLVFGRPRKLCMVSSGSVGRVWGTVELITLGLCIRTKS